jgi:hypothetical protein
MTSAGAKMTYLYGLLLNLKTTSSFLPSSTEVENLKMIWRFAPHIIFMFLSYRSSLQSELLHGKLEI